MTNVYNILQNIVDWIIQNVDSLGNVFIALMTIIVVYICSKYNNAYVEGVTGSIDIENGKDEYDDNISSIDELDDTSRKNIDYIVDTDKKLTKLYIDEINKIPLSQQDDKLDNRNLDRIVNMFRYMIRSKRRAIQSIYNKRVITNNYDNTSESINIADIEKRFVIEPDKKKELDEKINTIEDYLGEKLESVHNKSFKYTRYRGISDSDYEAIKQLHGARILSRYMDMQNTLNEVKYFLNNLGKEDQSDEGQLGAKTKEPIIEVAKI
jgi:hypothetical protein